MADPVTTPASQAISSLHPLPASQHGPQQFQDSRPDSTYDVYDDYLNDLSRQSGIGAVGMGLMTGDMDDDSDDETPASHGDRHTDSSAITEGVSSQYRQSNTLVPIAAPRPGYAAPVTALTLALPEPAATLQGRQQMSQFSNATVAIPFLSSSPRAPFLPPTVPSTPHPLLPPMSPITPAFARPPKSPAPLNVKFPNEPIMRSDSEETLLPKRGEKGDDFWRRFSMVAKEQGNNRYQQSTWLKKTQSGSSRMSRWVWVTGIFILLCIAGAIGLGWWISHKNTNESIPVAIGGSENDGIAPTYSSTTLIMMTSDSSRHVSPTNTVARRHAAVFATGFPLKPLGRSHL